MTFTKSALVCGAGGVIGSHMVNRLKKEGFWVRGVDLKFPDFPPTLADGFIIEDLRDPHVLNSRPVGHLMRSSSLRPTWAGPALSLPAKMMRISCTTQISSTSMLEACYKRNLNHIFYSSSACMYPEYNQKDPDNPNFAEDSAYPAESDREYGWGKLFSE